MPQPTAQPLCMRADRLAAMLGADHLADQHRRRRPFAAEAEAHQRAADEQLREVLRKAAEEGEDREPEDGDLQVRTRPMRSDSAPANQPPKAEASSVDGADQAGVGVGDVQRRR